MARSFASSSARPGSGPAAAVPRVYLDYAGFSPVDPRVVAVMRPFLEGGVGNPGAPHSLGLEARASLDGARAKVARLIGGTPSGVIFTASATEANNLAIKGVAARAPGRHIVTSAIEHVSVINACRDLEKQGFTVTYVPVDAEGRADPDAVARWIRDDTAVVSLMASNGEIGTLEPISAIGRLTRERGVALHVDAVGAAGGGAAPVGAGGGQARAPDPRRRAGRRVPRGDREPAGDRGDGRRRGSRPARGPGGGRPAPRAARPADRPGARAAPGGAPHWRARGWPTAAPRVLRGARREGGRRPARAGSQRHRRLVRLGVQRAHGRALARAPRDRLRPRGARGLPLLHARTLDHCERDRRRRRDAACRGRAPAPPRAALTCGSSCLTSTARC